MAVKLYIPIIETQAGDILSYIYQQTLFQLQMDELFLQSDLFFSGVRPAINTTMLSRVGGVRKLKQ